MLDSLAVTQVKRNFPWRVNCRHRRSYQLHRQTARGLLKGDRQRGYVPTSLPITDDAAFEVEGELLYSDIATPASERALTVDNEDVQS